eukprot:TRINITY_DN25138_c0_g1_i1.p1 TRINITY_DN25138_c0_g1~~TRINITY_DN25138_c0_g1_i1.p1  ORF type:complete len:163 (-),score=34.03 TRINITY_DN25138_c0_g1_i1:111-599(-)
MALWITITVLGIIRLGLSDGLLGLELAYLTLVLKVLPLHVAEYVPHLSTHHLCLFLIVEKISADESHGPCGTLLGPITLLLLGVAVLVTLGLSTTDTVIIVVLIIELLKEIRGAAKLGNMTDNGILNLLITNYVGTLSLIHISEPTRLLSISYAVFCLKKKK